jgi:uncharacterized membrane protein YeaQ/YmgE (transglycosylase-associated protein family)
LFSHQKFLVHEFGIHLSSHYELFIRAIVVRVRKEEHMQVVLNIVLGFFVGLIAKLLTPGRDPGGFIITTLLGIAGSLVAYYIGRAVGWYQPRQSAGFFASIVGAVVLLVIYHMFRRRRTVQT